MPSTAVNFLVDSSLCTRCGSCAEDCPAQAISQDEEDRPYVKAGDEEKCFFCQHCLAICPAGAVTIRGVGPEDTRSLDAGSLPKLEQMELLALGRRSVRSYRDENVDPRLLARLLDVIANAPTGVNSRRLKFTLIDDKTIMGSFRSNMLGMLEAENVTGQASVDVARMAQLVLPAWREGRDVVFRTAPHLLLVSSPRTAPCAQQDVVIALAYFELLAQSAGLGTVWCGYLRRLLECLPAAKSWLDLPQDHVYYPMLFGVPAVRYARTVQRGGSAEIHKVERI